eukprot:SAG11_NODE_25589_length_356_cov_2.373541_1_plen_65_part_10
MWRDCGMLFATIALLTLVYNSIAKERKVNAVQAFRAGGVRHAAARSAHPPPERRGGGRPPTAGRR